MKILPRIKKKEYEGFKEFIRSLETTPMKRRKELVFLGFLEDPAYMEWVGKNILTIEMILEVSTPELEAIIERVPRAAAMFATAFFNTDRQPLFLSGQIIPRSFLSAYKEALDNIEEVSTKEQESAQHLILKSTRDLIEEDEIRELTWHLPTPDIIKKNKCSCQFGEEVIYYDGDIKEAAVGQVDNYQRDGAWVYFYPNGNKMAEGHFKEDKKSGDWTFWYMDGRVKSSGSFFEDEKNGEWTEWDEAGEETNMNFIKGKPLFSIK